MRTADKTCYGGSGHMLATLVTLCPPTLAHLVVVATIISARPGHGLSLQAAGHGYIHLYGASCVLATAVVPCQLVWDVWALAFRHVLACTITDMSYANEPHATASKSACNDMHAAHVRRKWRQTAFGTHPDA
jgi:hypothetical protein